MRLFLFLFFVSYFFVAYSQADIERLKKDVYTLASDSFLGRYPYTKGDTLTTNYILNEFRNNNVETIYRQEVKFLFKRTIENAELTINNENFQYKRDFVPSLNSESFNVSATAVFVGFGLYHKKGDTVVCNYYSNIDVKDKWVFILDGKPDNIDLPVGLYSDNAKVKLAADKKAAGVIFITKNNLLPENEFQRKWRIPVIYITKEMFEIICKKENKDYNDLVKLVNDVQHFEPVLFNINIKSSMVIKQVWGHTNNIIGITRGSHPDLKNEYIIVGAHFDHLGEKPVYSNNEFKREIYNGADDNASGVAGMLELMRIFQRGDIRPARSIVWVAFSAEELGLLGSKKFVDDEIIPLSKIKTMINLDMIGRMSDSLPKLTISGVGTSKVFDKILKKYETQLNFKIIKTPDGEGPSDHASFFRKNIPVLFFNSGLHLDYHKPTDDANKINYIQMANIVNFLANLIVDIANYPKDIKFTKTKIQGNSRNRTEVRITLGIIPDVTGSTEGLLVEGVKEGGIAEKGGIKKGDIIIQINNRQVRNIYDYMDCLNELDKSKYAKIKVKRGNEIKDLNIQIY
jgi:hypothetical protein